jgi:hypothetical protein
VPLGSVRAGPVRWRGRARLEGPGGESAEGGGEAMVVGVVRAGARWCERCGLSVSYQLMSVGSVVREYNSRGWRFEECWSVGWLLLSQSVARSSCWKS